MVVVDIWLNYSTIIHSVSPIFMSSFFVKCKNINITNLFYKKDVEIHIISNIYYKM